LRVKQWLVNLITVFSTSVFLEASLTQVMFLLGLVLRSNNKRQCVSDVTLYTIMKHMLMIILGNCSRWCGCSSTFVLGNLFQRDKELNDKRRNRGFRVAYGLMNTGLLGLLNIGLFEQVC
jgi:hypothetical protein